MPSNVPPGTYQLRFLANDGFTVRATSNTFTVTASTVMAPASTPLTASPAPVTGGGSVTASWNGIAAPTAKDWIGLYTPGAATASFTDWIYVSCSQTPGSAGAASGSCPFVVPSNVPPGTYQLRFLANDGFTVRATSNTFTVTAFTVTAPASTPLTASPATVTGGGSVTASWNGIAAPTATDWIGLYTPGSSNAAFITWVYVSCSMTPGGVSAAGSCPLTVPTTVAGTYQLRLFTNDGFGVLATSNAFTVQ